MTLQQLQQQFDDTFLIADRTILKMIMALLVSHDLKQDPVWIMIVAPSSSLKSEFINSMSLCNKVFPLSTITSQSFISGARNQGKETSLLHKIGSGIITFKDFTSLLSENQDTRSAIMAQLREIYDGSYTKAFGTGENIQWKGKITILAASTYAIHSKKQQYTSLGERFLFYEMEQPDRQEAAIKSLENQQKGQLNEKRELLSKMVKEYREKIEISEGNIVQLNKELIQDIAALADLTTQARSSVNRDYFSPQREILSVDPAEMPPRFVAELTGIAVALCEINKIEYGKEELQEEDRKILYKLCLDSIDRPRRLALQELAKFKTIETAALAIRLNLPTNSVRRWLEDLNSLKICDRQKASGTRGDKWMLKDKYKDLIRRFDNIKEEGDELLTPKEELDLSEYGVQN